MREEFVQKEPQSSQPQEDDKPRTTSSDNKTDDQTGVAVPVVSGANTAEQGESAPESSSVEANWVKHIDRASGKPYYHDTISNKTQWEEPAGFEDSAPPMSAAAAEYQAHLNRVRTERLTRVTQQVLDPTGSLGRLNTILSGINPSGGETEQDESAAGPAVANSKAEWQQHVDPHTQRFYYHNVITGETKWQKPDAPVVSGVSLAVLKSLSPRLLTFSYVYLTLTCHSCYSIAGGLGPTGGLGPGAGRREPQDRLGS